MKRSHIGSSNSHAISVRSDSSDDDEPPTIPASRMSTPRRNGHPNTTNQTRAQTPANRRRPFVAATAGSQAEAEIRQATPSHTRGLRNIQDVSGSSNLDSPVHRESNPSIQRSPTPSAAPALIDDTHRLRQQSSGNADLIRAKMESSGSYVCQLVPYSVQTRYARAVLQLARQRRRTHPGKLPTHALQSRG
ncbi:hypothetical protein PoMZ_10017 [Pyricularia oryzae]|uniref:Uncharacterized protein n=1 Tax=Pyricularia oryzae TaxID=318829 RepID=A0A4P7MYU3_PYROR|nr:hypothetical protein PoMZ_10017 [Pyricularia oryzae]